jgi:hypothetical protein
MRTASRPVLTEPEPLQVGGDPGLTFIKSGHPLLRLHASRVPDQDRSWDPIIPVTGVAAPSGRAGCLGGRADVSVLPWLTQRDDAWRVRAGEHVGVLGGELQAARYRPTQWLRRGGPSRLVTAVTAASLGLT